MLIEAADLLARMKAGEKFITVDVRDKALWQQRTLPGAYHLNVYDYFIPDSTEFGIQQMANAFQHAWQQLKLSDGVTPVFFEQQVGMRSPRGAWFAQFARIQEVYILNGGLDAWLSAGGELLPGNGYSATVDLDFTDVACRKKGDGLLVATRDEVINAQAKGATLIDARRPSEFYGEFAHDCCPRAGRIPGAVLLFWEDVLQNGAIIDAASLRQLAGLVGLSPQRRLIIYCHRGARAATVYAALKVAGYENLAIYVGSWHEWAEHSELPILTGR
ncbi:sulfurtransferase [Rouxiella silvae]|uniref:Sulfurtransferase n=1 Tax=Rouxiella silvae TaxID=1646373 RepID=A0ABX3TXW5_9GAMM|nr:rhodanese-like domain-containing protein [Rouxiella silvae]ORJ19903.1 sulfurtransferase [Rouxiella silvae]